MYISEKKKIHILGGEADVYVEPSMANRHGLIAGATGTGKTVTLKVLAESFSDMGVPVFLADIKGDLSGLCKVGSDTKHILRSKEKMGLNFDYTSYPVSFWDVYGRLGVPVRTTVSEMGPDLFARLLELNDTQSGILRIVFRIADDEGLLLIDLKDLRSMLKYVADNAGEYKVTYGNITSQSVGAIQRALLKLEDEGGDVFFGEPALELKNWVRWSRDDGRGIVNILECKELALRPTLYSTFLLWMLTELYEMLPEVGDLEKPKLVFFFDEAHLLFDGAPKALVDKVEQVVRLIRSKGVGVWFITQNPSDLPDSVLGQIGNRIQHALRAYTPNDQKALRSAARSFRVNPDFDTEQVIQELGVGQALVSVLDENGIPTVVQKGSILPPRSSLVAMEDFAILEAAKKNEFYGKYSEAVDRESAYEMISAEEEEEKKEAEEAERKSEKSKPKASSSQKKKSSVVTKAANSMASSFGRSLGNKLVRGIFGNIKW